MANIAASGIRHVFLRDMLLQARIGVHRHEQVASQRVRINVDLAVTDDGPAIGEDRLARVVDYEAVANRVRTIIAAGHVQLVETLAEQIADSCLSDARVLQATIRVEKLDVFPDAASAGVEITRRRG